MMISTRGRYALRVMIDLAQNLNADLVPMKHVAQRQGISLKYLEQILPVLVKNGFIEGAKGKGGGYRLRCLPQDCTVGEILRLTEGDLAPVACLEEGAPPCEKRAECKTLSMWSEFYRMTNEYFDSITIADLVNQ